MPSLFRFLFVVAGLLAALGYGALYALAYHIDPQPRADHRVDPAGPAQQAPLRPRPRMARRPRQSDETLIELFLDMLAAERGAAANTLAAYRATSRIFPPSCQGAAAASPSRQRRPARASGRLGKRGFAASSVARRLSAIRQLHRFLYSEGHRSDDPAAVLEGPKRGRALPKVLSVEQVDDLLAQARAASTADSRLGAAARRAARCLLEVLYATGLRVSELVALPRRGAAASSRC